MEHKIKVLQIKTHYIIPLILIIEDFLLQKNKPSK